MRARKQKRLTETWGDRKMNGERGRISFDQLSVAHVSVSRLFLFLRPQQQQQSAAQQRDPKATETRRSSRDAQHGDRRTFEHRLDSAPSRIIRQPVSTGIRRV